ncbi:MAG: DUF3793 family protein [Desulfitobacteriaceae bacterium]
MPNSLSHNQNYGEELYLLVQQILGKPNGNSCLVYVTERIGATLAGAKPAEILTFPLNKGQIRSADWERSRASFLAQRLLGLREIRKANGTEQVFFYHGDALDEALTHQPHLNFLQGQGYPLHYKREDYLDLLIAKLQGENFPHEIGLFLGYPLKDVLGFMGHPALKLVKTRGWKVYGSERLSDLRYESFQDARNMVLTIMSDILSVRLKRENVSGPNYMF